MPQALVCEVVCSNPAVISAGRLDSVSPTTKLALRNVYTHGILVNEIHLVVQQTATLTRISVCINCILTNASLVKKVDL